jgi:hypothetical protein
MLSLHAERMCFQSLVLFGRLEECAHVALRLGKECAQCERKGDSKVWTSWDLALPYETKGKVRCGSPGGLLGGRHLICDVNSTLDAMCGCGWWDFT